MIHHMYNFSSFTFVVFNTVRKFLQITSSTTHCCVSSSRTSVMSSWIIVGKRSSPHRYRWRFAKPRSVTCAVSSRERNISTLGKHIDRYSNASRPSFVGLYWVSLSWWWIGYMPISTTWKRPVAMPIPTVIYLSTLFVKLFSIYLSIDTRK